MKFSYQWLSDFVPGLEVEPSRLERLITMKTAECEGVEPFGAHLAHVVTARVVSAKAIPNSRNKLVRVEVGQGSPKEVVCGAPNVAPGMLTAWVPAGTVLADKTIGLATIDGVASEGMLASGAELGINADTAGILELSEGQPGKPLPQLRPDWIIDIDNKSLTHRPDLWGHYGMAREVAAVTGRELATLQLAALPEAAPAIRVHVDNAVLCPRYSALVIDNITVAPAPLWMQARLEGVGLNPISNIVDLTNWVLAELPQPMHAFDADKLRGDTIYVRLARSGEQLAALNGETYQLTSHDLVIADASGPIALAGVIGGADSAISASTRRVVFESANFNASSVRLTSTRHKLRTDASMRFEKSLDPENTVRGIARAVELLRRFMPQASISGGLADARGAVYAPPVISLPVELVTRKLGKGVSKQEVVHILQALGFTAVEEAPNLLMVTVPSWRATKDIGLRDDLVEEVGRMVGYGEITPAAPMVACVPPPQNPVRRYLRKVRRELADQGFSEVYSYSFVNEAEIRKFSLELADHIAVQNPIASEQTHLRSSLLPGLFRSLIGNVRHFQEFRLFEIGNEIHLGGAGELPREVAHAAALLFSLRGSEEELFEMKRVVECLLPAATVFPTEARPFEHPERTAEIRWGGAAVGRLFELHPSILIAEGISGRAFFFDIDCQLTQQLAAEKVMQYRPVRRYPTSGFDLSIVSSLHEPVAVIEQHLRTLGGDSLVAIDFVRQYSGAPLAEGHKSVSYHIEAGANDHTLTADEAGEVRNRLIAGMRKLGYELRV